MTNQTQLEKSHSTKICYDNVFQYTGEFGRYQRRIFLILCLPALSSAFHKMGGVFLAARPEFRCSLPDESPENATYQLPPNIANFTYLWDNETKSWPQCELPEHDLMDPNHPSSDNVSSTSSCESFVYDKTQYTVTATTEWHLVCDNAWLKTLSESLFMLGDMPGVVILGELSDRHGRRSTLLWGSVVQLVCGLLVVVSPDFNAYMILRVLVGTTTTGLLVTAYVAVVEMVSPKHRMTIGISFNLSFTTGYILSTGLAYFIRRWRGLQIAFSIPILVLLIFWRQIPESARWLLSKGRVKEAKDVLEKSASKNGIKLSPERLDGLLTNGSDSRPCIEKTSVLDLLRSPNLRKKSLVLFFIWFVNSVTYYGLSMNTSNLGGDDYLNFVCAAAVEIPAYTFLFLVLDRWGRKIILCGGLLLAGMVFLVALVVPADTTWPVKVFAMAGKWAITCSWGTASIATAEHYPTSVRNVGVAACLAIARLGGAVAPYINYLFQISTYLPFAVLGSLTLLAGLLSLLLPETLNKTLPESIEDSEHLEKNTSKTEGIIEQLTDVDVTKFLYETESSMSQKPEESK